MQYTSANLQLAAGVVVVAGALATCEGFTTLHIVCTGPSIDAVESAVCKYQPSLSGAMFAQQLDAEDVFGIEEHKGLYFVTLG